MKSSTILRDIQDNVDQLTKADILRLKYFLDHKVDLIKLHNVRAFYALHRYVTHPQEQILQTNVWRLKQKQIKKIQNTDSHPAAAQEEPQ